MNEVGGVDAGSGPYDFDAQKRDEDDELARLRSREAALSEAYKRDPGDLATMGALVRVQQRIRDVEEHAQWLAANDAPSAHDQLARLGVKLPVGVATLTDGPLDARPGQPAAALAPFVETRATKPGATPAPSLTPHPTAPAPYRGVALYAAVEADLPPSNATAGSPIAVGPYRLHLATSNGAGVYYVAYNVDTKRNEYAVGARDEDVATFRAMQRPPPGLPDAAAIASLSAPKSQADLLSQRAVQLLFEQRYGEAAHALGEANLAAWKSPEWWMKNAAALGLGLGGAAPVPEELSPIADGMPRAAPELRLVANNPTLELRALDVTVDGNAALDLAAAAPRPALSLVPTPAPEMLDVAPLATPWAAPGLFAMSALRPATALSLGGAPVSTPLRGAPGSDELANGCVGRPLGYHLGGDDVHNACADGIGNDFPGSDYLVVTPEGASRAFDLARLPDVGEVKTGKLSYYSEGLANRTIADYATQARSDQQIAERCGLTYTLYIADPAAAEFFAQKLEGVHVELANDPTCQRP